MHFGFIKDMSPKDDNLFVGLDVGTTKTCVVVGEITEFKRSEASVYQDSDRFTGINIIGAGIAPSKGMRKGVVTNIEGVVESVKRAVQEAEDAAGIHIRAVHIGITGDHIGCISSHGVIAVKGSEIGQHEIDSVIDAARAVAIPFDREMLHVIPAGFTVNGQKGISDPRGMGGVRLETDVKIITGAATSVQNLIKSCKKAGLEAVDIVFQPVASAEAVLTQDDRELGVAVVDIGGGTTDMAFFHEGALLHTSVLSIGGNNFTNDVAIGLRIPTKDAEELKKRFGCSMITPADGNDEINITGDNGRNGRRMPRRYLIEILQPRAEEMLGLVRDEIVRNGFHKNMNAGVVLTGGAAMLEGIDVMAENILELPVRTGTVDAVKGSPAVVDNPLYAGAIGLVLHGAQDSLIRHDNEAEGMISGIRTRMKGFFGEVFK